MPDAQPAPELASPSRSRLTRSSVTSPVANSTTGVFKSVCLFCGKVEIQVKYEKKSLVSCASKEIEANITTYARMKNDQEMLLTVRDITMSSKEVKYHAICRTRYQVEAEAYSRKQKLELGNTCVEEISEWQHSRNSHQKAFEVVVEFIDDNIINRKEIHTMKAVNKIYLAALIDIGGDKFKDTENQSTKVTKKIQDYYGDRITVLRSEGKKSNLISAPPLFKLSCCKRRFLEKLSLR